MNNRLWFGLCVLLMICMTGCSKTKEITVEQEQAQTAVAVKAETIEKNTLYKTCSTNGNVRVEKSIEVFPVVMGRVVSSPIKLGDNVRKGDVLAVLDPSVSGSNYSLHQVISPISGSMLSRPVQCGTVVSSDSRIAVIGDLSTLGITAYIPERFYSFLKPGLRADIRVEAYGDEVFPAAVTQVAPVVDEASRTTEVVITLKQKNSKICAGMFVDITLYLEGYKDVISVPVNSILERDEGKFVYLVDNGRAEMIPIETARIVSGRAIVSSGLAEGDVVIVEGLESVSQDIEINVVNSNGTGAEHESD